MLNRPATRRLHIRSISDITASHDAELADLFSEMREATGLEVDALADHLHTTPDVIAALERGEIAALPDWEHTKEVVSAYAALLKLDPRPVLRRIMVQLPDGHPRRSPSASKASSPRNVPSGVNPASKQRIWWRTWYLTCATS